MTTPLEIHPHDGESSGAQQKPRFGATAEVVSRVAWFTSVLVSGVFAGFLTGVLVLEASLRNLPAPVYTQVRLVELAHLDDLATALLPVALLATVVVVTMPGPGRTRWLAVTALALLLAVFVISLLISVPINTDQQSWSVLAPPNDWASVRDRWQIAHLLRTASALLAFVAMVAATGRQHRRDDNRYAAGS